MAIYNNIAKGGKMFRKKGFTLLELIIVIIVIGILASIALPRYLRVAERSRMAEGKSILGTLRGAQLRYQAEHGNYTDTASALDADMTTSRYFDDATVDTDPTAIASVTRNSLDAGSFAYTLSIAQEGNISCTGSCPE
jgi:prepilin-type N-terminal cleavage/methylation domain-containing protein